MARRAWSLVLAAALGLALVSLMTNLPTSSQLSGEADTLLAGRMTVSKVVNAGAVWAGLGVLSGWLVRRPLQAVLAGIGSCTIALVAHYGAGSVLGLYDTSVWASNSHWFGAAVVLGGPLGLTGALARRPDLWGLAARLAVPVGIAGEPVAAGMFASPAVMPWPDRVSSVVGGSILIACGIVGGAAVIVAAAGRQWPRATSSAASRRTRR